MNRTMGCVPSYCFSLTAWLLCIASLNFHCAALAEPPEQTLAEQIAFQTAVRTIAQSVVRVEASGLSIAALQGGRDATPTAGPSSGLVVGSEGWILTTEFAVPPDMKEVVITLPPNQKTPKQPLERLVGRVVGRDLNRRLVLLKCNPKIPLAEPQFATQKSIRQGQWALAVGRVWDPYEPSVAIGIVSAVDRCWSRAIQTDAAISPVNYGGPLLDIQGHVLGVIAPLLAETAGMETGTELYDSGVGFAVPMHDIAPLLPRLKKGETLRPGLLGIGYSTTDPINGRPVIEIVRADSPAAKAGMQSGDQITSVDGQTIQRIADIRHALTPKLAGDLIKITLRRDGEKTPRTIEAVLTDTLPPWKRSMIGIIPARQTLKTKNKKVENNGVIINSIWPNSPAEKAGLAPQDTITAIALTRGEDEDSLSFRPLASSNQLAGFLGGLTGSTSVVLKVRREDVFQDFPLTTALFPGTPLPGTPLPGTPLPGTPLKDTPAATPIRGNAPPAAIVKLDIPEVAETSWAVVPDQQEGPPLGVLVFFDEPSGILSENTVTAWAASWRRAASRHRVAAVLLPSSDSNTWRQADLERVGKTINVLSQRYEIDPTRIAFAGFRAGGTFAWLGANRFEAIVRGVCLIDADIPRRSKIQEASPERFRWVLFGTGTQKNTNAEMQQPFRKSEQQLRSAGIPVGLLSFSNDEEKALRLCQWVEALGLL
ncbi:MAG: PDZ domain-containing protein [Planctomycetaceae bacterium]|nr:PDZ domain-containing protein [Planctomycetaceae bacterium]